MILQDCNGLVIIGVMRVVGVVRVVGVARLVKWAVSSCDKVPSEITDNGSTKGPGEVSQTGMDIVDLKMGTRTGE